MAETLKLRLTLDVEYNLNGADPEELRQNLRTIAEHAIGEGMLTGDSEAIVEEWGRTVTDIPEESDDVNNPDEIIRWLHTLPEGSHVYIDDDGMRLKVVGDDVSYLELGGHTPDETDVDFDPFDQWDPDDYDVEGMRFDYRHGNFNPVDAERYQHTNRLRDSFINGQFTQAREICARHGMDYDLERYKFDGYEDA